AVVTKCKIRHETAVARGTWSCEVAEGCSGKHVISLGVYAVGPRPAHVEVPVWSDGERLRPFAAGGIRIELPEVRARCAVVSFEAAFHHFLRRYIEVAVRAEPDASGSRHQATSAGWKKILNV